MLNVPKASHYVLWLPTFRYGGDKSSAYNTLDIQTETGLPILDSINKIDEVNALCKITSDTGSHKGFRYKGIEY